jgi:periplasmic copper chaperone A
MTIVFRLAFMLAALLAFTQAVVAADISIVNARARASLTPTATSGAVYFSVENEGKTDETLLAVMSPAATSAMIHETTIVDNVMKMRMVEGGLVIPAGQTRDLATGATHVMLMGLKAPLKSGDTIHLELVFETAGKISIEVPVGNFAD